jgi:N utilization substance protein A
MDEENNEMEVVVPDDQLSLAIGRRGQNVRLASKLTGWRLDIKSEKKLEAQMAGVRAAIALIDGLDDMQAGILVNSGVKSPEEVVELSPRNLSRLLNLDEDDA